MLLFLSTSLFADTIVMKDGRRIEAEQVWLEGEMVRYKKFGTIIGLSKFKVAKVIRENPSIPRKPADFGFDHWKIGMPIGEVMAVAERNNVPLHREGLVSVNRNILQRNACRWRLSGDNTISLVSGSNWTELFYESAAWKKVLEKEQNQEEETGREVHHRKDAAKF